jgi:hypothetical protein
MIYKNKNLIIILLIIIIIISITTIIINTNLVNRIDKNDTNQTDIELNKAINTDTTVEITTGIDNILIDDFDDNDMDQIEQELQNL